MGFGYGARKCIGMNFTILQARITLAMLVRKYKWKLPEDSVHKEHFQTRGYTLVTAQDLDIIFERLY